MKRGRRVMFAETNCFITVEDILDYRYMIKRKEEQTLNADVSFVLLRSSAVLLTPVDQW
jgi:hypothetical protein